MSKKGKEKAIEYLVEKKTRKKTVDPSLRRHSTKVTPPRCPASGGSAADLESRFQSTIRNLGNGVKETTYLRKPGSEGCSSSKKVLWADTARLALTQMVCFLPNDSLPDPGSFTPSEPRHNDKCRPEVKPRSDRHAWRKHTTLPSFKKTYKEALLTPASPP